MVAIGQKVNIGRKKKKKNSICSPQRNSLHLWQHYTSCLHRPKHSKPENIQFKIIKWRLTENHHKSWDQKIIEDFALKMTYKLLIY